MKLHRHADTVRVTRTKRLDPPNASGREKVQVTVAKFSGEDAEADAKWYKEWKEGRLADPSA